MKIKSSDGTDIDTKKLSDIEAVWIEQFQALLDLSTTYNIPFYCAAVIGSKPVSVHHLVKEDKFHQIVACTAYSFSKISKGKVKFVGIIQD